MASAKLIRNSLPAAGAEEARKPGVSRILQELFAEEGDDELAGGEGEVRRLIELNGMIGVDPLIFGLD
jgi:hypothetical protein